MGIRCGQRRTETTRDAVLFHRLAALLAGGARLEAVGVAATTPIDELDTRLLLHVKVEHGNVGEAVARVVAE